MSPFHYLTFKRDYVFHFTSKLYKGYLLYFRRKSRYIFFIRRKSRYIFFIHSCYVPNTYIPTTYVPITYLPTMCPLRTHYELQTAALRIIRLLESKKHFFTFLILLIYSLKFKKVVLL